MTAIVNALFVNWKTTLAGVVGAISAYLITQPGGWGLLGQVLAGASVLFLGVASKDSNVTGGSKPQPVDAKPGT